MEIVSLFRTVCPRIFHYQAAILMKSHLIAMKPRFYCSSVTSTCKDRLLFKYTRILANQRHCYSPRCILHCFRQICTSSHLLKPGHQNRQQIINLHKAAKEENISVTRMSAIDHYVDCSDKKVIDLIKEDFLLYEDFVTEEEEASILKEIEPYLNRLKYEHNHWDDAIHGFRETERKKWTEKNKAIIQRVRDLAFPPHVQQMAYVHILDIKKTGYIKPHVDAVRFCGSTIAGISLLSSAVMRLVHTENKDWFADALLKRRSLYIMRDTARYQFTHEVLSEEFSRFKGEVIPRDRRISVICRNEPSPENRE